MKKTKRVGHTRRASAKVIEPPTGTPAKSQVAKPQELQEPEDGAGFWHRNALAFVGLGLLATIPYLPALWSGFVWDDVMFTEDPVIHRWSGLWNIWLSPADLKEVHYWPVVYTSFWLEHKLWGLSPFGYHLVNLLLYAANVVLVWRLLLRLAVPGAWAVAAVFAVHPVHVESVAWIIERKDLLSGLFYLGATWTWLRFTEAPRAGRYGLTLGLYIAALLSKSIAVTLPAALLILQWWKQGHVTRRDWLRVAPFFLVGLCITVADLFFYISQGPVSFDYGLTERILIASRALWFYVGKLVWPDDLAVIYPIWDIQAAEALAWIPVMAAAAVAVLLWLGRHHLGRGPLAGAAFFAVTLSPVLGFVDHSFMNFSLVADRFQYLASLGVLAVLVGGGVRMAGWAPNAAALVLQGLLVAILLLLGMLTWGQVNLYRNGITLFTHVIKLNPEARFAVFNLGHALITADRAVEGLVVSRIAAEQQPDSFKTHYNVGQALLQLGRLKEAETSFRRALELNPRFAKAHHNLGETLRRQRRYEQAIESYHAALAIDPAQTLARIGTGIALYGLKRYEEAAADLELGLSNWPGGEEADRLHLMLGRSLRKLDRPEAAAAQFQRALEIDPQAAEPLLELVDLLTAQQRFEDAETYLRRVPEPERVKAEMMKKAETHRKNGRHEEAVASYRAVLALEPDNAPAPAGMGAALLSLGRYEAAIESLTRSADLASDGPATAAFHVLMGLSLQGLGRSAAATDRFERAVATDPGDMNALELLAESRLEAARYEEALALRQSMLDAGHVNAQTYAGAGIALLQLKRHDEALPYFERALSLDPTLESARAGVEQLRDTPRQEPSPSE